ncbi:MAG: hypothetical protein ACRETG_08640, partial [Steroidobacteraceae bacterium]
WKLDHTASTDPQQVIGKMRAEANKLLGRRRVPLADGGRRGGAGDARQSADESRWPGEDESAVAPGGRGGRRPDPLRRSPMMHILTAALERGDYLTVRQSSDEFVLDYGTSVRSFTPGQHSVVSTEGGVGDQVSGWQGRDYVITVKAQLGPNVVERYGLSSDGKQLVERLDIGPAELPAVELTRVYNHTEEAAPPALPTTD